MGRMRNAIKGVVEQGGHTTALHGHEHLHHLHLVAAETSKAATAAPTNATGVAGKNDQEKADADGSAQDADAASDQADGWLNYVMGSSSYCTLL